MHLLYVYLYVSFRALSKSAFHFLHFSGKFMRDLWTNYCAGGVNRIKEDKENQGDAKTAAGRSPCCKSITLYAFLLPLCSPFCS